jgi:hypothetical protein
MRREQGHATAQFARGLGIVIVVIVLAAGCSSGSSDGASRSTATKARRPPATKVGTPDAPAVCSQLADSKSLTSLGNAIADLVAPDSSSAAQTTARTAAATLDRLEPNAPNALRPVMKRAGSALRAILAGTPDDSQLQEFTDAFESLGEEVQAECHFPLQ